MKDFSTPPENRIISSRFRMILI